MEPKIKILVSYHKKDELIKNEVFTPIQVGRSLNHDDWLECNMIGDNDGENISDKNNRCSELTAQYYTWKNYEKFDSPDYIGFCHYRRLFNLSGKEYPTNIHNVIEYPFYDKSIYEKFGLSYESTLKCIEGYDVVTIKPTNLSLLKEKNVYTQYYKKSKGHYIKDYNLALKILKQKHPDFVKYAKEYNNSKYGYYTNSYIMRKDVFTSYMEWLFPMLLELDELIPQYKDKYANRVIGFIAERFFGIYLTYMKNNNYKIKEVEQVFLQISKEEKNIYPIAFSCDNRYLLPLCAAIKSIQKNAKPNDFFFFYILNDKKTLNYLSKKMINRMKTENCIIKYVSVDKQKFSHFPLADCKHATITTYFRFILPDLFPLLDKILYLDCDITVLSDLKELFNAPTDDCYILGVKDIFFDDNTQRLNLLKYCNAGILLFNIKRLRADNKVKELFEYAKNNTDLIKWADQDVINSVLQDGIAYIDNKWNAQVGQYEHCYTSGFNEIGQSANILHYIGSEKPWKKGNKNPFKQVYYNYVKMLPKIIIFYCLLYDTLNKVKHFSLKELRKKIIWYDKRNKKLMIFKKIEIPF